MEGRGRGAGYWTVVDQAEVSPDSKPSEKIVAGSRTTLSKCAARLPVSSCFTTVSRIFADWLPAGATSKPLTGSQVSGVDVGTDEVSAKSMTSVQAVSEYHCTRISAQPVSV